jgi:hypothetical protein
LHDDTIEQAELLKQWLDAGIVGLPGDMSVSDTTNDTDDDLYI